MDSETKFTSLDPLPQSAYNGSTTTVSEKEKEAAGHLPDKMTKFQILKNLVIVSFGFLCLFTAFQSLSNLQSSLNKEEGIGTGGLSIIYASLVISCLFTPSFLIAHLGCKWTVALSMGCYILYMAANFYAVWWTIAPAAFILGLGAAPLWSAKCTYLTQIGVWYAKLTGATEDDIINKFFGFFFMAFQTSQIWGNLISSMVFTPTQNLNHTAMNLTCGAAFCPGDDKNNTNLDKPPIEKVYTVCGIYVGFACLAVIVIIILFDKIDLDKDDKKLQKDSALSLLVATFKHCWESKYQKLLIVITMYSGLEQAFITADYTKSFVSCTLGIWNVGFVMICYGVTDALCSFTFGRLVQYVGHIPFFILAFLVHGGVQITLLLWTPDADMIVIFYVLAALWGMGDAVIQTQINALYGYLFTDNPEAAFANYRLWESIGFIIAFAYANFLCTDIKLYILLSVLTVGMLLYGLVEIIHRSEKTPQSDDTKL